MLPTSRTNGRCEPPTVSQTNWNRFGSWTDSRHRSRDRAKDEYFNLACTTCAGAWGLRQRSEPTDCPRCWPACATPQFQSGCQPVTIFPEGSPLGPKTALPLHHHLRQRTTSTMGRAAAW